MAVPPNSYLLGVLLVAQTRAGTGAQVLFHYPPDPLAANEDQLQNIDYAGAEGSSSSDSDSESSSDDNVYEITSSKLKDDRHDERSSATDEDEDDGYSNSLSRVQSDERWKPSWEPLLGIGEEGLVSLLAPGRAWHKRKFEMSINDLIFVGRPVYARESGAWWKRRRKRGTTEQQYQPPEQRDADDSDTASASASASASDTDRQTPSRHDDSPCTKSSLIMFHLVFVMNPPPLEHTQRVKDMYDNVVRKLSKVLKWDQTNNDYVWTQTDLIQGLKSHHYGQRSSTNTLYSELLKQSSLAAAVATVYRAISTSRIAAVTFSPDVSISLQIPPVTSTSYLPSLTEPPIQPGLWLTTANDNTSTLSDLDIDASNPNSRLQLAKSFTLLLRDHPQKILKDVQATSGPLALPLADFITSLTPSKSFNKISQLTASPLADIQLLSRHLIYWRRATAIPPLHHRDTYIVSPNANLAQLVSATKSFEAAFPMLPSLPRLLSLLSSTPAPFGALIPSSDHKDEYYRVLAWLLRGGWVTQLRTFAYIRISPAVKKAVRDHDRQEKHDTTQNNLERLDLNQSNGAQYQTPRESSQPQPKLSTSSNSASASFSDKHQFRNRPRLSRPPSSSTTTTTTTTTTNTTRATASGPQHNPAHASLIISPLRASALENKWLSHIQKSLLPLPLTTSAPNQALGITTRSTSDNKNNNNASTPTTTTNTTATATATATPSIKTPDQAWSDLTPQERQDLHAAWPRLIKYFNGQEALEKIAVREGWKRKWAAELLGHVGVEGFAVGSDNGSGGGGGGGGDVIDLADTSQRLGWRHDNDNDEDDEDDGNGNGNGSGNGNGNRRGGGGHGRRSASATGDANGNGHGHGRSAEAIIVTIRHW